MFDRVIIVDWSAASHPTSAKKRSDAIWIGCATADTGDECHFRTRAEAEAHLAALIGAESRRSLIGFDFAMGYPRGFASHLTGEANARAVWHWLAEAIVDAPDNANNRFDVAARINALFPDPGPFWSHPRGHTYPGLPARKTGIDHAALGVAETRRAEVLTGAKSVWMLCNPGAVGSQSLTGLPMIHRLSQLPGTSVWPFDAPDTPVVLAEIYPSLLGSAVAGEMVRAGIEKDRAQVRLLARALLVLSQRGRLGSLLAVPEDTPAEEGWILGAGHAATLLEALR